MRQLWTFDKNTLKFEIITDAIGLTLQWYIEKFSEVSDNKVVNYYYKELLWVRL